MMKKGHDIRVYGTAAALARAAAGLFASAAVEEAGRKGFFTAVLPGGATPERTLCEIAAPGVARGVPWSATHLFWGDERCVPPGHPESNFRMAEAALISRVEIPPENVHRMRGEGAPAESALAYEEDIRGFFSGRGGEAGGKATLPSFDLVMLGLGTDGHTLSVFPGSTALAEGQRLVVEDYVERLGAYRLTMTLPLVNNARQVVFLVSGPSKAGVLERVIAGDGSLPASRVRPAAGGPIWLVDAEAGSRL